MLPPPLRRLLAFSFSAPRTTVAIWAAFIASALVPISLFLQIDTGTNTFLDRTGPEWSRYQRAIRQFGGDEYVAISLEGAEPYDWSLIEKLPSVSASLAAIPGVRRVDSLATVPLVRLDERGAIRTEAAIENGVPEALEARRQIVREIEQDPVADRFTISDDRRHLAVNVMLDADLDSDRAATVDQIREVVRGLPAFLAGVPIFRTEVNQRTQLEVLFFVPVTILLIAAVAYFSLRSFVGVIALLSAGSAGSTLSLAAMALTDVPLSLSTMLLPSVLLALGCAYAGHVLVAAARAGAGPSFEAVAEVVPGIAWSGVTTAIGFAAMSTTSVDAIRQLAAYGALGVFVIAACAISLVPAILVLGRARPVETGVVRWWKRAGPALAAVCVRHRLFVISAWAAATVMIGAGAAKLTIETNIIEWFSSDDPIRVEYENIREQFSGITPVSVVVRSSGDAQVTAPGALAAIESLRRDLEQREVVGRALAITQPLRAVREAFGKVGLPESVPEAEQYLLILGSEDRIGDLVSNDREASAIWVRMNSNDSRDIVDMASWVDGWWASEGLPGFDVAVTGVMYEFARAQNAIAATQVRGLLIAIAAIGVVLAVALGSLRLALGAMIPNALPIALAFGGMGMLGVPIDAATVCLGSLALGIAVDDTVHVMLALRGERTEGGATTARSWAGLSAVVPALVLTTVCIAIGFGALGFSSFTLVRNLGLVTAVVVVLCLVADLTLLPALVLRREVPESIAR